MILLGIFLLLAAGFALFVALGLIVLPDAKVRRRLRAETDEVEPEVEVQAARIRQLDAPEDTARYVVSGRMASKIEQNLVLAGHPSGWSMRNVVLAKIAIPVVMFMFVAKFAFVDPTPFRLFVGIAAIVVGYFVPDLLIYSRGKERQEEMQLQLPDLLDKIVITLEAGMGFESALARTAESGEGPLADEFVRTVQDIRLGMSRRDAYEALQARTSSDDIHSFLRGIIQAEEHGSSISGMVRIQSKEMRVRRKLRAEAKAGQVSVKLLGPLMACIFPVLFVVVLAPGIMNAFNTL